MVGGEESEQKIGFFASIGLCVGFVRLANVPIAGGKNYFQKEALAKKGINFKDINKSIAALGASKISCVNFLNAGNFTSQ